MSQSKPTKPPLPECAEGPEAFQRFDAAMTKLLSVSKATLLEREKKYRKKVDANPNRPGPKKRKVKRAGT